MKKILTGIALSVAAVGLAACGSNVPPPDEPSSYAQPAQPSQQSRTMPDRWHIVKIPTHNGHTVECVAYAPTLDNGSISCDWEHAI